MPGRSSASSWTAASSSSRSPDPMDEIPRWIVHGGGHCDVILYGRYVPLAVAAGIDVTLAVPPGLHRLLAPLGATLVPPPSDENVADAVKFAAYDAWMYPGDGMMRLPGGG